MIYDATHTHSASQSPSSKTTWSHHVRSIVENRVAYVGRQRCSLTQHMYSLDIARKVSQVCHLWREVAISTAQLWATLNLTTVRAAVPTLFECSKVSLFSVDVPEETTFHNSDVSEDADIHQWSRRGYSA